MGINQNTYDEILIFLHGIYNLLGKGGELRNQAALDRWFVDFIKQLLVLYGTESSDGPR